MNPKRRIVAFHLLNDRSGSPKVLSQVIKHWVNEGRTVILYTSLHQDGFLSNIPGVEYRNGWYQFKANPWMRLLYYTLSQFVLLIRMFQTVGRADIVYVNTVLPFGAAVLGKLKGARVIYHIHESTVNPAILKWFLFRVVAWGANDIINVSHYVARAHGVTSVCNHLVYNAIDKAFVAQVIPKGPRNNPGNVLMVCSLKAYKGVFEFVNLARDNPQYRFQLVLNASQANIETFFAGVLFPSNLEVYPSQNNLHPFFQWADVILNLSLPDGWVETFGLTIVEGMAYGLPAIVPTVGGVLEVIEEGVTGFSVDARDRQSLNTQLRNLLDDPVIFQSFSNAARNRLKVFDERAMLKSITAIV